MSLASSGTRLVRGTVAPGYEGVAEQFERSFSEHGELGAAFAAVRDGELVVDLWGGVADADAGRAWTSDTVQAIFSGTKAFTAVCTLLLIERGQLALDAPVATWWPEFAAAGKAGVTVREVVSHTARLPGVRAPLTGENLLVPERIAELLAAQPQETDPRAAFMYHGLTYGWLCGELVRRADPARRTLGRFFAEEFAAPLGLEAWIGLPLAQEPRVATLRYEARWATEHAASVAALDGDELLGALLFNPPVFPPDELRWNRPAFHAAENGGAGGIATARSVARLYGCLARGGELDGVRLLAPETVALGTTELARGIEAMSGEECAYAAGFRLQTARRRYGPPADAFGHDGAGGSVHGAWPSQRVGFSYATNELRWAAEAGDPRVDPLLEALHHAGHTHRGEGDVPRR